MSSRLRSLDSKISFFAFADIITAVSGVLIFVALLLATDLGRPDSDRGRNQNSAAAQQLAATQAQQAAVDAQNQRLEQLLAMTDTAPDLEKLQADIAALRGQLRAVQQEQASVDGQMSASETAIADRDRVLGLTDLNETVQRTRRQTEAIATEESLARNELEGLEKRVAHAEAQLVKLRQRDGQVWLVPEKSITTKEPIFVTVGGTEVTVEFLDHPERRRQLSTNDIHSAFDSFLGEAKSKDQYFLFLVRPSGINLFKDLVAATRSQGFEVGFDALEEDRKVHFSAPPPIDEPIPATVVSTSDGGAAAGSNNGGGGVAPRPAPQAPSPGKNGGSDAASRPAPRASRPATAQPTPPAPKSWWERLLEWLGLRK